MLGDVDRSVRPLTLTLGTKKRRIVSIVVLRYQSVFQRLMLLDYQIRLDLASGTMLVNLGGLDC